MRSIIFILTAFICFPCKALELIDGEKIPKSINLPLGKWQEYRTKDGMWSTWDEEDALEQFKLRVEPGIRNNLEKHTLIEELILTTKNTDKKHCDSFSVHIISTESKNGYPSTLYSSSCRHRSNSKSMTLHRITLANEASYFFDKLWGGEPSKTNYDTWFKYISNISVCTKIDLQHPCQGSPDENAFPLGNNN